MLVFIDESGDPGFKLDRGSSRIFSAAMVVFDDAAAAQEAEAVIRAALVRLRARPEFKFSKCSHDIKDAFFAEVANLRFCVRAIVVKKELIYSDRLRTEKEEFYRFLSKIWCATLTAYCMGPGL